MLSVALGWAFPREESYGLENLGPTWFFFLGYFYFLAGREVGLRVIFVFNRKLSSEELERKRQEMMENAKWREEERLNILKRHAKDDEREQRLEKLDSRDGKFIQ